MTTERSATTRMMTWMLPALTCAVGLLALAFATTMSVAVMGLLQLVMAVAAMPAAASLAFPLRPGDPPAWRVGRTRLLTATGLGAVGIVGLVAWAGAPAAALLLAIATIPTTSVALVRTHMTPS